MALTLPQLRRQLPEGWARAVPAGGSFGLGYDVATTDGATSNPSAIVARQQNGSHATEWLVVSFKSRVPDDSLLILRTVASDLRLAGHHLRRCCVDSSNEKYHATRVRAALRGLCPVAAIGGGDTLTWDGEEHRAKQLLGALYIADYDDNLLTCPRAEWIKSDRRLVKLRGGRYDADVDDKGRHADTFDAGKLAKWACIGGKGGGSHSAVNPPRSATTSPRGNDSRTTALHSSVKPRRNTLAV